MWGCESLGWGVVWGWVGEQVFGVLCYVDEVVVQMFSGLLGVVCFQGVGECGVGMFGEYLFDCLVVECVYLIVECLYFVGESGVYWG